MTPEQCRQKAEEIVDAVGLEYARSDSDDAWAARREAAVRAIAAALDSRAAEAEAWKREAMAMREYAEADWHASDGEVQRREAFESKRKYLDARSATDRLIAEQSKGGGQ